MRLNKFDFLFIFLSCLFVLGLFWFLSAKADTGNTALVTVVKPTKDVNDNPLTSAVVLNYYQSVNSGPYVKVATTENASMNFIDLPAGQVCYKVSAQTAVNPEGAQSPPGCKSFPFPAVAAPGAPTVQ